MSAVIAAEAPSPGWPALLEAASRRYRGAGRFAWHFARGKLRMDPVFRHLVGAGLIAPHDHVLDVGCGQGLVGSLLQAAGEAAEAGGWPIGWPAAPTGARFTGIELMPRDVRRARQALGESADIVCGDMRSTPFPKADAILLLDVLHYIAAVEQQALLARAGAALNPGGRLLLRVADASVQGTFRITRWVDGIVAFARRGRSVPLAGRSLAEWVALLESLGFQVRSEPMSQGTVFANVLLVARSSTESI